MKGYRKKKVTVEGEVEIEPNASCCCGQQASPSLGCKDPPGCISRVASPETTVQPANRQHGGDPARDIWRLVLILTQGSFKDVTFHFTLEEETIWKERNSGAFPSKLSLS